MQSLWLLVLCFGIGMAARRSGRLPVDSHRVINAWVLNVALPALVLKVVHAVEVDSRLVLGAALLWLEFVGAVVLASALRRSGRLGRGAAGALALTAGLGNTAFVGLPLLEGLGGRATVGPAAVLDQLGSFVAFSLIAVPFAAAASTGRLEWRSVWRRLWRFGPFLALVAALLLRPLPFAPAVDGLLGKLADTMSPLALASVGWQLDLRAVRSEARALAWGLAYKLALAPAVALGVVWGLRTGPGLGLVDRVVVAQVGMAPMVTAGVLALEFGLEPGLASAMIGVGVPLSVATVPLWWALSGSLGG